ncbi:hypothetical protein DVH24_030530 [Malus domestica]|uniref:Uncharacterized protein n=1 Tax=Malus domestica TaxID=3750 RepID=A0A498JVU8_MALDO|nr:hypothetical protein DVH24_030530 [Malus domestica]
MSASLTPIYGEAAPKSRTRDLPLMGEDTCHRTKFHREMGTNMNFKGFGNKPPLARQSSIYSLMFKELQNTIGGPGKDECADVQMCRGRREGGRGGEDKRDLRNSSPSRPTCFPLTPRTQPTFFFWVADWLGRGGRGGKWFFF